MPEADGKKKINSADWHELLACSIQTADQLAEHLPVDKNKIREIVKRYSLRINPYYLSLIKQKGDPIWKQAVPDIMEIRHTGGMADPLSEERQSPVPNLIHRYPDRVLFLVSDQCAMYCRHCMRKRKVGEIHPAGTAVVSDKTVAQGIAYIRKHEAVREVLVSGGDPLLLEDEKLGMILEQLRSISHVEIIRIHTRVPCTLPQRITVGLVKLLKRFHPLYINTHFNHPDEITAESAKACTRLADAGIPLGCQTVLLKGVNDDAPTMARLMQQLLKIRVKPYYIHHPDLVRGTAHFRTPVAKGLEIMAALRGFSSGMCVPQYMIDLSDGGGKVPLLPEYVMGIENGKMKVKNYQGEIFEYPLGENF